MGSNDYVTDSDLFSSPVSKDTTCPTPPIRKRLSVAREKSKLPPANL